MTRKTRRRTAALAAVLSPLLCASVATAEVVPIDGIDIFISGFEPGTDPANGQVFTDQINTVDSDGNFAIDVPERDAGPLWQLNGLSVSGNIDPIANLDFAVTNTTGADLDFVFMVTVPIAPPLPATVIGGSAAYTVTDANGNFDATFKSNGAGDPYFDGLLDGVSSLTLIDAPFSTTTVGSSGDSDFTAGFPTPTIPSGAALATIGIEINFTLSAGDSASGTTTFIVELIPEPTSLALLFGVGVFACVRRR